MSGGPSGQPVRPLGQISRLCGTVNLPNERLLDYNSTYGPDEMKCTRLSTSPGTISSVFAGGAVDEPAAEGGENIVRGAFLAILGGANIVCWGVGTEGKRAWCCLASDRTLSRNVVQ